MSIDFISESVGLTTINDFLRFGLTQANNADLFYGHGTDNSWDEVRSLVLRSLSLPHDVVNHLLLSALTSSEKQHLCNQLDKRINQRIPVPYLVNEAYFCDIPFYVDERVLIPRSPIAELIQNQFAPWVDPSQVGHILDLCTGSGCIAIACCYAFPEAKVDAIDLSTEALAVATMNSKMLEVEEQLQLIQSDCFNALTNQRYDIIVSNPPYVGRTEMESLPAEFLHEPRMALETENNGLAVVETILNKAHHYLNEGGILVVEVGNSEFALADAFPNLPFTWLEFEHGGYGVFLLTKEQLQEHFE